MPQDMPTKAKKKRVLIVGSGASGTAAAYALGKHPDKFDVQVWEKKSLPGGVATSEHIEGEFFSQNHEFHHPFGFVATIALKKNPQNSMLLAEMFE